MNIQPMKKIIVVMALFIMILFILLYALLFIFSNKKDFWIMCFFFLTMISFAFTWVVVCQLVVKKEEKLVNEETIHRLILLDGESKPKFTMDLQDRSHILIGKNSMGKSVDLDLSYAKQSAVIGKEHAILNNVLGKWYVEAIEPMYLVGLKPKEDTIVYRLKTGTPYQLNQGDMIYITGERILLS